MRNSYFLLTLVDLQLVASVHSAETFSNRPKVAKKGGEFTATFVKVVDGDTLILKRTPTGRTYRLRLAEIDAPEKGQPFGTEAAALLTELALSKPATIVENRARDAKVGLWALPSAQRLEPWEWRKLSASERKKIREQL